MGKFNTFWPAKLQLETPAQKMRTKQLPIQKGLRSHLSANV
jgi:hypothetical protein